MRILLIAPYYPPYNNPRAARWGMIVQEWMKRGWEIDVITGKHPANPDDTDAGGLRIFRPAFPAPGDRIRQQIDQSGKNLRLVRWVYRLVLKSWYWPDQSWQWKKQAIKLAKTLCASNRYDALLSVSLPFSAQEVARNLHTQYPEMVWLADMGDPFSLQAKHPLNNRFLYKRKNRKAEKRILEEADGIIVTCAETKFKFEELVGEKLLKKIHIIPPISRVRALPKVPEYEEKIQIGYFGRFFPGVREAQVFIAPLLAFARKYPVHFHFFGDTSGLLIQALNRSPEAYSYMDIHGQVGDETVAKQMSRMHFLLSLGNATNYQLPSKTADYLCSAVPIIHLQQLDPDAISTFLEGYEACLCLKIDKLADSTKVGPFLEKWKSNTGQSEWWEMKTKALSAEAVASGYAACLLPED
ncbi:MAG: hypothetical protein KDC34_03705 [Saprospiraceae bacterium]|nr:hypothetical protein [Saprospiraceae bacterium]